MTQPSIPRRIAQLQAMSLRELRLEWKRLYDEEPPSIRNRTWFWRRLSWRVQELAYGGLSDAAKARLEELMPTAELALRNPPGSRKQKAPSLRDHQVRDRRIPPPGTVLLRKYKNESIAVSVLENGFEWQGREYGSLSAVAKAVTGSHLNGVRFFHLDRKEPKK